jgi:hypothetical protein
VEESKDDEEREREDKTHHLYQLKHQLEQYLQELPVDSHKIKHTVKRNNNFMFTKTEKLKFLDITKYRPPGFSYSQYLKAYKCTE